jgi:hypothetical protein
LRIRAGVRMKSSSHFSRQTACAAKMHHATAGYDM